MNDLVVTISNTMRHLMPADSEFVLVYRVGTEVRLLSDCPDFAAIKQLAAAIDELCDGSAEPELLAPAANH
jgi:hypothetical protein